MAKTAYRKRMDARYKELSKEREALLAEMVDDPTLKPNAAARAKSIARASAKASKS